MSESVPSKSNKTCEMPGRASKVGANSTRPLKFSGMRARIKEFAPKLKKQAAALKLSPRLKPIDLQRLVVDGGVGRADGRRL